MSDTTNNIKFNAKNGLAVGATGTPVIDTQANWIGATGLRSPYGATGVVGYTGVDGATGYDGASGSVGYDGATGYSGATGSEGLQGDTGIQGPDGVLGPTGVTGDQGQRGATGGFGGYAPNTWTFDSVYKNGLVDLENNNTTAINNDVGYETVLGTTELDISSGNYYYMFSLSVDLVASGNSGSLIGIANQSANLEDALGSADGNSVGFKSNGTYWFNGAAVASGLPQWNQGDTVDIAVDQDDGWIWIRVNGGSWNNDPSANPGNYTGGLNTYISGPWYQAVSFFAVDGPTQFTIQESSAFSVPSGYASYTFLSAGIPLNTGYQGPVGATGHVGATGTYGTRYKTTSTTHLDFGTLFTTDILLEDIRLSYSPGQTVVIADSADATRLFHATVNSYDSGTNLLNFTVTDYSGTGGGDSWIINIDGAAGVVGASGVTGLDGSQGELGAQGQRGSWGVRGDTGIDGATGVDGATGYTGASGITGDNGEQGVDGHEGYQGASGATGYTGATGITGDTGNDGEIGPDGIQGPQGPQGNDGYDGLQGQIGPDGASGIDGSTGSPGVKGVTGLRGATGFSGTEVGLVVNESLSSPYNLYTNDGTTITAQGYQQSALLSGQISDTYSVVFSVRADSATTGYTTIGVGDAGWNYAGFVGQDTHALGLASDGQVYFNGSSIGGGYPSYGNGDIIDVAVNYAAGLPYIWFRVNGGYWNNELTADPVTGSGAIVAVYVPSGVPIYPAVGPYDTDVLTVLQTPTYTTPSGYIFLGGTGKTNIGHTGSTGATGYTGASGAVGQDGATGSNGTIGYQGVLGPDGDRGVVGATGSVNNRWKATLDVALTEFVIGDTGSGPFFLQLDTRTGDYNYSFYSGQTIIVYKDAENYATCLVSAYNSVTGELDITVESTVGSSTLSDQLYINTDGALGQIGASGSTGLTGATGYAGASGVTGGDGSSYLSINATVSSFVGYTGLDNAWLEYPTLMGSYVRVEGPISGIIPGMTVYWGGHPYTVYKYIENNNEYSMLQFTDYPVTLGAIPPGANITIEGYGPAENIGYTGSDGATGIQGASGSTGYVGLTGDAGLVGASGPQGIGGASGYDADQLTTGNPRGLWDAGTTYYPNDIVVTVDANSHRCLVTNTGLYPDSYPDYWNVTAYAGASGASGYDGLAGYGLATGSTGLSSTSSATVDRFASNDVGTAKYLIQAVDPDTNVQATEVFVTHTSTGLWMTEYASLRTTPSYTVMNVHATTNGSVVSLNVTPKVANTNITWIRESVKSRIGGTTVYDPLGIHSFSSRTNDDNGAIPVGYAYIYPGSYWQEQIDFNAVITAGNINWTFDSAGLGLIDPAIGNIISWDGTTLIVTISSGNFTNRDNFDKITYGY